MQNDVSSQKLLLAFVGMPGSGKSEAATYLKQKGFAYVRFGEITEEGLSSINLPLTPENEQMYREKIRTELGMAAYAIRSEEKIQSLLHGHDVLVIDGLYSWEEYVFLGKKFKGLRIVYVFANPAVRYERLMKRAVRPLSFEQAKERDFAEIEKLNKSGPIAMADYVIENNASLEAFHLSLEKLITTMGISV